MFGVDRTLSWRAIAAGGDPMAQRGQRHDQSAELPDTPSGPGFEERFLFRISLSQLCSTDTIACCAARRRSRSQLQIWVVQAVTLAKKGR